MSVIGKSTKCNALNLSYWTGRRDTAQNFLIVKLMPFYSRSDYNIENEFLTTKTKIENLLDDKLLEMFEQILIRPVWRNANTLMKTNLLTKIERGKNSSMFSP